MVPCQFYLVCLISCLAVVNGEKKFKGRHLPDYIVACKRTSPDFPQCTIDHAKAVLPHIYNGEPKFKVPRLVPFKLEKVVLKPSSRLTLILKDLELYGLDTIEVTKAKFDFDKKRFIFNLYGSALYIVGKYNISGQILVLPISGEGSTKLMFDDASFEYTLDYDLIKRTDEKEYMDNLQAKVTFKVSRPHYQLDNLFNGNKELGDNTNQVLNDNAQEVLKDFGEAISEVIKAVATNILTSFLTVVPFDEIFLP